MNSQIEQNRIPETLKQAGLRVTPQRVAILQHVFSDSHKHQSADEIYRAMRNALPNLSISTVYNTLKTLSDAGLIRELKFGDGASLFDANMTPHHHMICDRCGTMIDFYLSSTPDLTHLAAASKFQVEQYHIELRGICENCQNSAG
jgi:Fur family peroxide stress response transcriptional regulator